jgi:hypothetical protein
MTDQNKPITKHKAAAKEHLAGVKGAHQWIQDLSAQGLLRTQYPIRDQPDTPPTEAAK